MSEVITPEVISTRDLTAVKDDGFLEFYSEFDKRFDELKDALKKTTRTQELAASLKSRGGFKNFMGGVTGRNDKELAEMVGDLGASMEVTQVILQLVMRVQNTKNRYLREFHASLVNKIASIQGDTITLDSNQKEAAIAIVSELSDQIRSQIEQQEIVENHQKKLQELDGFVAEKENLDASQDEKIHRLESRALEIIRVDEEQQRLIEELKNAHASKDELDRIQTQRIDMLITEVTRLELDSARNERTIKLIENQQYMLILQVRALDEENVRLKSARSLLLRNALPAIALVVGVVGILLGLQ